MKRARAAVAVLEGACLGLTQVALAAMVICIVSEVLYRGLAGRSFEVADEFGGYFLVAVTFLALAPAYAAGAFHRVDLVRERLSARARWAFELAFVALSLGSAGVLAIATTRYAFRSWQQGDVAATVALTPLWIPQSAMALGLACLCVTLAADLLRRLATPPGVHHGA